VDRLKVRWYFPGGAVRCLTAGATIPPLLRELTQLVEMVDNIAGNHDLIRPNLTSRIPQHLVAE
jgi:hypothetical protein